MSTGWRANKKTTSSSSKRGDAGPCPTKAVLDEAALGYLSRGAATAATLTRVLNGKIARWARRAERATATERRDAEEIAADIAAAREAVSTIVTRFREVGLVNDATFAESRVRSLSRAGRSQRAIAAHLAAKGVDSDTARNALPNDAGVELAAALTFARKRRIGPFAREGEEDDRKTKQKALAAMARAGFGWSVCERAFGMDRERADDHLRTSRL